MQLSEKKSKGTLSPIFGVWEEYVSLFSMFDRIGVPDDSRWRSLLLYFREIKDYNHLTDAQKVSVQTLLTRVLESRDYSEDRLESVLREYHSLITRPYRSKVEALLKEVSDVTEAFQKTLLTRCGDLVNLEKETIAMIGDEVIASDDPTQAIERLSKAFGRLRSMMENDMRALEHMATKDSITNLANRHSFDRFMDAAVDKWINEKRPLTLALFDIDHFKRFNDDHGHRIGDQVLAVVGSHLQQCVAQFDEESNVVAARYGGEEFALAVSGSDAGKLDRVAEQCRNAIRKFNFLIRDKDGNVVESGLHITISVGIAHPWEGWRGAHRENLIDNADKALYFAKQSGRNRTIKYRNGDEPAFDLLSPGT